MNRLGFKSRRTLLASAALAGMIAAAPAYAQDQPAAPPPATARNQSVNSENSQDIVVTAQKREQILLDVPASVTVVGGETLDRQQATNFQDYLSLIPGFSLEGDTPGESRITLRGANTGGVASTVAVFMDDVPFGSSTGLANGAILSGDFDPFDLNRIEVLRGPQGTLYGAASFGGVLKFVTNKPRLNQFEARAQAGIEDTKGGGIGFNSAGVVNVPLGDKAALRVSGFYRNDPGYINSIGNNPIPSALGGVIGNTLIREDLNEQRTYGGRASLLFQPVDALQIRLTAFAQNLNSDGSSSFDADPDTLKGLYGGFVQSVYQPEPTKVKYRVYSGTIDYDMGFANFFSSTSYSTFSEKFQTDFSALLATTINLLANFGPDVPLLGLPPEFIIADPAVTRPLGVQLFQTTGTDKFTQEFRLASPSNDSIEWLVGLFYTHEKSAIDPQDIFATEFGTSQIAPDVAQIAQIFLKSKYDEYAAFANATWHITPRFDLTVGGRLAHNKQDASLVIDSNILGDAKGSGLKSSETVFTYSVAPRYELSENASIYARVATGYRPGGPNVIPAGSPEGVPDHYDADRLTSWEVGVKAQAPDRFWSFEATAYHLDWKDIQLFASVNDTGINANGGKAKVNGLELSGALRPTRGLTLAFNGAYTHAELKDDTPPETGGLAGDPLPWSPRWSGAVHADYEFPLSGSAEGFVGGSVSYTGRQVTNLNERDEDGGPIRIPTYAKVDLRAGVNVDRWTIEAFAKNLFDKKGITSAAGFFGNSTNLNGGASIAVIRPRTIGVVATMKY